VSAAAPSLADGARVALVHDWLTGMRGGERVLERIARFFPGAPIHTLVWKRGSVSPELESRRIVTSFLQWMPDAVRRYRSYLPLFPRAVESLDLSRYDVVVSTSHAVAKGARPAAGAFHLSYIFTPMRYVWELEPEYFPDGRYPWPVSAYVRATCARLRKWDVASSGRAHALLADSAHVADRIRRHWSRDATVVHPPVEVERFHAGRGPRDAYLIAGAFAPYKRNDLALRVCRRLGRKVVVAGSGQDQARLQALGGDGVTFHGWLDDAGFARLFAGARALLFPGEEDFGILPVEAMAAGCPVIAYGVGGALETVGRGADPQALECVRQGGIARVPGGILFGTPTEEGLAAAIERFERERFDPAELRRNALPFAPERFDREFAAAFTRAYGEWFERRARGDESGENA